MNSSGKWRKDFRNGEKTFTVLKVISGPKITSATVFSSYILQIIVCLVRGYLMGFFGLTWQLFYGTLQIHLDLTFSAWFEGI